jgi:DNA-binding NarL/FixJ family response regulator
MKRTTTKLELVKGKRARKPPPGRSVPAVATLGAASLALISSAGAPVLVRGSAGSADAVPVFLIEDNRLLRDGLTAMLGAQGLKVLATARSGGEALRQVTRLKPTLVLLDSAIGDRDSLADTRIIVMHLLAGHEDIVAFVRAGVSGFIMKDASVAEFVATIRSVADGHSVLPATMATTLFSHVAAQAASRGKRSAKAAVRMTVRERQVIGAIAEGLSNKEIADRLHVATHTVKSHVHNILEKLALHTRLEVAAFAHADSSHRPTP